MPGYAGPVNTASAAQKTLWGPLALVTSLFFLWGLAYGLLDVLNKHFQEVLGISRTQSTLLQFAYFGAYFVMGLYPAGAVIKKFGYKAGILMGLSFYIVGAICFYPSSTYVTFPGLVASTFVIACGLSTLEAAANPYIAVLGPSSSSTFRLNLSQSFNGIGSVIGPIIGSYAFFGGADYSNDAKKTTSGDLSSVKYVYLAIAGFVALILVLFIFTKLPEINEAEKDAMEAGAEGGDAAHDTQIWEHTNLLWGIAAQFSYVGAQVGIAGLFINFVTESIAISSGDAALYLTYSLIIFTAGRFIGSALLKFVNPRHLLALYSLIATGMAAYLIVGSGKAGVAIIMSIYFFESIMFPTIFTLAMEDLGKHTRRGASFMISSLVGGAIFPLCIASVGDATGTTARGMFLPMLGFLVVLFYALVGSKVPKKIADRKIREGKAPVLAQDQEFAVASKA
ncbi:L-fucose:H+ symporter permease [Zopfochytrium polystomum]|nr:L-fucose:H+ symporter permease [Zopfochytrium polystomum]